VLLSAQRANLFRGTGTQYVDRFVSVETERPLFWQRRDLMFEDLLGREDLRDRNFVVLHLRTAHGPYAENYSLNPELAIFPTGGLRYGPFQANTYDNAVRYNDLVMTRLMDYFRASVRGPLYVFLTSDHGQLLGDSASRRFGHGMLLPEVAHVPVMLYAQEGDAAVVQALRELPHPTHFDLTALLARLLGFEIHDPNARDGVYYVNGTGYYGRDGYMVVRKGGAEGTPPQFEVHAGAD
jgi:membrane-anchored protein YejM (alkaline phosphatase superfamily)